MSILDDDLAQWVSGATGATAEKEAAPILVENVDTKAVKVRKARPKFTPELLTGDSGVRKVVSVFPTTRSLLTCNYFQLYESQKRRKISLRKGHEVPYASLYFLNIYVT